MERMMRLVVNVVNGSVEDISSDESLPDDLEIIIMTDDLRDTKPEEIGRADGRDVVIYALRPAKIDDRRFWREVEQSRRKFMNVYDRNNIRDGISIDAIDGEFNEVISKDRRLPCA
jgi:hypothetical protein